MVVAKSCAGEQDRRTRERQHVDHIAHLRAEGLAGGERVLDAQLHAAGENACACAMRSVQGFLNEIPTLRQWLIVLAQQHQLKENPPRTCCG